MEVNRPDVLAEVEACFARYEDALTTNDVALLSELFWADPAVVRFGPAENLYGHEEIASYRRQRPADDLTRELLRIVITTFGSDFATTSTEFRRTRSGRSGRQSQTWARTEWGWRIVAAHVSALGPGS